MANLQTALSSIAVLITTTAINQVSSFWNFLDQVQPKHEAETRTHRLSRRLLDGFGLKVTGRLLVNSDHSMYLAAAETANREYGVYLFDEDALFCMLLGNDQKEIVAIVKDGENKMWQNLELLKGDWMVRHSRVADKGVDEGHSEDEI